MNENEVKDAEFTMVKADQPHRGTALATPTAPMNVDEVVKQVQLVQQVMRQVMQEGQHYGNIPGTAADKKVLLQPGAQKLCMTFRLAPEYAIQETLLANGHKEYRVTCTLVSIGSGAFVGQGVGVCSSMESKYRWRNAKRTCPACGKATIIPEKAEYMKNGQVPGWVCWQKQGVSDGCRAKYPIGAKEIESQPVGRVENPDIADVLNTVLKMAKKRAFVDATVTATSASDIFTQDIADPEDDKDAEPAAPMSAAMKDVPPVVQPPPQPQQAQPPDPEIPPTLMDLWINYLKIAAADGLKAAGDAWVRLGTDAYLVQKKINADQPLMASLRKMAADADAAKECPPMSATMRAVADAELAPEITDE